MNGLNFPYHLLLPALIAFLLLGILFSKRKQLFESGKWKWFWISLTIFFLLYVFILAGAIYSIIHNQLIVNSFDLNKDGFLSGNEITFESKEAVKNLTRDTAINFSFFSGLFFSGIFAVFVFIIGQTTKYIKSKKLHNLEN